MTALASKIESGGAGCLHRRCCNPRHLALKTKRENSFASPQFNANKTHCSHGHVYDDGNTYFDARGYRFCRACGRERSRAYKARKTEGASA